jgi:hypothetical protein
MKKNFLLAGLFILFGCTSRLDAGYTVILKNVCDYPIDVLIPEKHRKFLLSEKHYLNSGEAMAVLGRR